MTEATKLKLYKLSDLARALEINAIAGIFTMIFGSPGTAKSAKVLSFAKQWNLYPIDLRLSQAEPTDMNGFPAFSEVNGEKKATYIPFDTIPTESTPVPQGYDGFLVFFDETNAADRSVMKAFYKVALDKMVGQHKIHPKAVMVGAGNLDTDGALVEDMGSASQSRMCNIELEPDREGFREHIQEEGWDSRIQSYLAWRPQQAYLFDPEQCGNEMNYPCFRTWEFVNQALATMTADELGSYFGLVMLQGYVGEGTAREFQVFVQLEQELPKIDDIIQAPLSADVPCEPGHLWALAGCLADNMKPNGDLSKLLTYMGRLPSEIQIISMRMAGKRDSALFDTPEFSQWLADHGEQWMKVAA